MGPLREPQGPQLIVRDHSLLSGTPAYCQGPQLIAFVVPEALEGPQNYIIL